MSTRKRPSKSEDNDQTAEQEQSQQAEESETIDDWLDNFDPDTVDKTEETAAETETSSTTPTDNEQQVSQVEQLLAEFTQNLPNWVDKPWMYVKPTHEGHLESWYESWKELILDYTALLTRHIVNVYEIQEQHPFSNKSSDKKLSVDQISDVIQQMVDENMAKWLDQDKVRARIYFKTDQEWADQLYQFTLDHGYALDVMTLYDLHQFDQPWADLPDGELRAVLDILVTEDKAEWIGSDRDTIQFKI